MALQNRSDKPNRPQTDTRNRLVETALALFSTQWYETVSVAEICRTAGLSNGVFYRYFKKKEDLFKELVERYLEEIGEKFTTVSGSTREERVDSFFESIYEISRDHTQLLCVYREGQYRFPSYEKRMRDIFTAAVSRVWQREVDESEYLYTCAGIRFMAIRSVFNRLAMDTKLLRTAVLDGIFTDSVTREKELFPDTLIPVQQEEKSSKARLIEAGIRLFEDQDFYSVNVYELAKEAGFSVGTFYLYFPTKEDFFAEIVRIIGHRTRKFISINLDSSLNRLEKELQGIYLFLEYFRRNRSYYAIVREAEFVVNDEVNRYYNDFEAGYMKDLDRIRFQGAKSKKVIANALLGISHYFGIEVLYSANISDEKDIILKFGRLLHSGMKE